jgi:hypothetical protein
MPREYVIDCLEAAVVLLMITNAVSVSATAYAMALVARHGRAGSRAAMLPLPAPLARWLYASKPQ